jgi:hypothetical protein
MPVSAQKHIDPEPLVKFPVGCSTARVRDETELQ